EASWEPVTGAYCSDERVYVERFGRRFLTVFNDSPERRTVTITLESGVPGKSKELVGGRRIAWRNRQATLTIDAEDVAVIEIESASR
ncbi:MAG: hypothetical protein JSU94_01020, partial [Phycisphaerales bacterium]